VHTTHIVRSNLGYHHSIDEEYYYILERLEDITNVHPKEEKESCAQVEGTLVTSVAGPRRIG
jgi:hypothetical protein